MCVISDQLKLSIRLKARLGESVQADMQKLQKYGEQCSSFMWRQVALYAKSTAQQLYCYHQSVTSLQVTTSFVKCLDEIC